MIFEKDRVYVGYKMGSLGGTDYVKFFKCVNVVNINSKIQPYFVELITLRYNDGTCNYSNTTLNDTILECNKNQKNGSYCISKYRLYTYEHDVVYQQLPSINYTSEMFERDFKGRIFKI